MPPGVGVLKALAEPTRLRIMQLVLTGPVGLCACELADCLLEVPADVSRHVKVLKYAGLVSERKESKWVYYEPGPVALRRKGAILSLVEEALAPAEMKADQRRLQQRMQLREKGKCLVGIQSPVLLKRLGRA